MMVRRYILSSLICLLCFTASQAYADVYTQAKQALDAGKYTQAMITLRAQVKAKPRDYQAWFLLGVAQAQSQRFQSAIESFRRVIELRNDLSEPHNNLAVIYNELGDVRAAVAELEKSLKKHPGYVIAEENIADLYVRLALMHYKKALSKRDNPALMQRYTRLLHVRDPQGDRVADVLPKSEVVMRKTDMQAQPASGVIQHDTAQAVMAQGAFQRVQTKPAVEKVLAQVEQEPVAQVKAVSAVGKQALEAQVLAALEAWRVAWESQNLTDYFAAYDAAYVPSRKYADLAAWKRYKARVIRNKTYIKVHVSDVHVKVAKQGNRAEVTFTQRFESNSYRGNDQKVLDFKLTHGVWKIVREVSI
jgi:tetratricopeptide (TPR) repeat protein